MKKEKRKSGSARKGGLIGVKRRRLGMNDGMQKKEGLNRRGSIILTDNSSLKIASRGVGWEVCGGWVTVLYRKLKERTSSWGRKKNVNTKTGSISH